MKESNIILLIIFIILAVVLNFLPHVNYPYPIHVDEWVHFQYSNHLSTGSPLYFGQEAGTNLEAGFHYILATLNAIGIPYLFMFNFFASLVTALICLGVFVLTRRVFNEIAGVFAVLFIAILESSVMILGPVFLVPMAIGLLFIAIGLYLIYLDSQAWILILAAILIIHPPSAMAFLLLINIEFIILALKKEQNYIKNIINQAIAGLIALPFYLPVFLDKGIETIENLNFIPITGVVFVPRYLGWLIIAFILIGIFFSVEKKKYSYTIYSIGLLVFIFIFYKFRVEVFIPYARALMYLFLIFSVLFGFGCDKVINIFRNKDNLDIDVNIKSKFSIYPIRKQYNLINRIGHKNIRFAISIALIIFILYIGIPGKIESNNGFYHIIDDKDYNSFIWIKENTAKDSVVLADPWTADALTPIAEREVFSRITQGPNVKYEARNSEITMFFNGKCKNLEYLKENNISVIYDDSGKCENDELMKGEERVYLVKQ